MQDHWQLLLRYLELGPHRHEPSLFDVAGYPHRETVYSNLLAFYLDPEREHGLGSLLLDALLACVGKDGSGGVQPVTVHREFVTRRGGRLDIYIETPDHVLAIENKLFAPLQNDLDDYRASVEQQRGTTRNCTLILLGLHHLPDALASGFVSITYPELWQHVRQRLGQRLPRGSAKWLAYLLDFIDTTERLAGAAMELTPREQFFIDHHDTLENLLAEHARFLARLNEQLAQVKTWLEQQPLADMQLEKLWVYKSSILVCDCRVEGHALALELGISPRGWRLTLHGRNSAAHHHALALVQRTSPTYRRIESARIVLDEWALGSDMAAICHTLRQALALLA